MSENSAVTKRQHSQRGAVLALGLGLLALLGALVHCSKRPAAAPNATSSVARTPPTQPPRLYSGTVVVAETAKPPLTEAANDLVRILQRATGATFHLARQAERGIHLVRSDAPEAPVDMVEKLRGLGREAYAIRSHDDGKLFVVANGDEGLVFGVYQYLESLGVRFYFPNERWTIVPRLRDIELHQDRVVRPAFRLRQFAGTGGLGKDLVVDPQGELAARWQTWKRQNGFGEEFRIDGHSGEGFNQRNKQTLLEHPEYLATVKGQRAPWSKIAKLDPTNPAGLELFVRDRVEAYRDKQRRDPEGPGSFAVSVEPADGGGFCDSEECEDLGTVSDQQFFIANRVAVALAKEFPNAKASTFAYNLHADVPNVAIEPNVYVTLVPYAFQRGGEDPEEFIARWSKKKSPLSIYDYWSIPDWTADLPVFDYRETPPEKLRLWRRYGIEGFLGESTYSAGAMGLAWYLAGHLMWDPNRDPKVLADEFFSSAFGPAAPPMRNMLERWAAGFHLNSLELRASFGDLERALRHAPTTKIKARLADFATYLQYLRLRLTWQVAAKADKQATKRDLLVYLWRARSSAMVNTFRLQQLLLRREPQLAAELDPNKPELAIWGSLSPITQREAEGWVAEGLRDYPELGVKARTYAGELQSVSGSVVPEQRAPISSRASPELTLVGTSKLALTIPPDAATVSVQLRPSSPLSVRLLDALGAVVSASELKASKLSQSFDAPAKGPGTYRLELRTAKTGITSLSFSGDVGVELEDFRIPKAVPVPDLYFYVPQGETAVALHDAIALPEGSGAYLRDGSGALVPLERLDGGRLLIARVPPGQSGRIWKLGRAVCPDAMLLLLNVPQRLALTPQALRVPKQALIAK